MTTTSEVCQPLVGPASIFNVDCSTPIYNHHRSQLRSGTINRAKHWLITQDLFWDRARAATR